MSTAIEDLLAQFKPTTASVRVCSGHLQGELDLVTDDLAQYDDWEPANLSDVDPRIDLRARKAALNAAKRETSTAFTFQVIGDRPWSDLLAAHPPRKGKEDEENFNPETFPVALCASASVEPKMSEDQFGRLFNSLSSTQRNTIFNTAFAANTRGIEVPFSLPVSEGTSAFVKKSK